MELSEKELKIELQSCSSIRKYLEQQLESVIARTGIVQENLRSATEKKKGIKRKSVSAKLTDRCLRRHASALFALYHLVHDLINCPITILYYSIVDLIVRD